MKTTHGAEMSPRMARLWTFMREQKIPLSDWSTDEAVERCQDQLRAGETVLLSRQDDSREMA